MEVVWVPGACSAFLGICLVVFAGSFRVTWVATMDDLGILVGSGHGLTSRPRETSFRAMRDEPLHSGDALLGGFLLLWYCMRRFWNRVPSWELSTHGAVGRLVVGNVGRCLVVAGSGLASASAAALGVAGGVGGYWVEGAGGCWKRVRLTRKTPSFGAVGTS